GHAALDDLTEQPGPRITRSWRPPPGRCRMGARETTPTTTSHPGHTAKPPSPSANPAGGSSSLPMIGRRLPASSSFVLAATRLRALQLDPGRTTAQPGSEEESHNTRHRPNPAASDPRSPGQIITPS